MRKYIIEKGDIDRLLKGEVLATTDGGFRVEVINMDKMTNGDVIKELFPNELDFENDFDADWWNAPYKESEVTK